MSATSVCHIDGMVIYLFLDTEDHEFFPEQARQAIRDICDRAEREIRTILPKLPRSIEVEPRPDRSLSRRRVKRPLPWRPLA